MRSFRLTLILLVLVVLTPVVFPAQAQGKGPDPVGLRPDAPPYAKHGPLWVGVMEFKAETPSHPTQIMVWYPALNPDGKKENVTYSFNYYPPNDLPVAGHALQNATLDTQNGPYPLIVFAHGWEGQRLGAPYLCEHLASYGFVVMSIDYADNQGTVGKVPLYSTLYTRPKDVSWQIDYATSLTAANGKLKGMVDTEHVAIVGHSHGGYTDMAAAGAQLDLNWFSSLATKRPEVCILPPELGGLNVCNQILSHQQELASLAGLKTVPEGLWPSWGDSRVDAIVGLAPATKMFGSEGLKGIRIPAMLVVGSADRQVSPEVDVYQTYGYLSSENKSLVTFENADHMIFFWDCNDGPWAIGAGAYWACSDPVWDMNRAHDLIDHFTTAFLLDVLKGDKDAHKALLPDAVKFAGIQYQTTMK